MGAAVAWWTVAAVLLQVAGLSLFLYGFFPVKPTLHGFRSASLRPSGSAQLWFLRGCGIYGVCFGVSVFWLCSGAESYRMPSCGPVNAVEQEPALPPNQLRSLYRVIDGLPAEFVLGRGGNPPSKEMMESMPYTQSLLAGCKATGHLSYDLMLLLVPVLYCSVHASGSLPQLSLFLFGVPIPKNNIGVLLPELFNSLTVMTLYSVSLKLLRAKSKLLLQQPINAIPLLLIFLQTFSSIAHFSLDKTLHKQWVQVIAMQFLGMAGHFGLGNTNSLASIDVAGAFIGVSSYSTVLSGILMFIITYGSPLMLYLGMLVYISVKDSDDISTQRQLKLSYIVDKMVTLPCLLPLLINSVALTSYTTVLLLMRNHLFVWSVFSPK
ncbi:hypothetical protein HU200_041434 [Digitaria exilis]|uniref:GPI ethanolamine phosphate transferase 2 C-terminal domain-containing protein n=1 Tax=Digitaria exilis TaxID=1010633 RepID=A0A835EDS8_9POAL|nr:hypothetical protein HU200_041434 [Digitaria exilis]